MTKPTKPERWVIVDRGGSVALRGDQVALARHFDRFRQPGDRLMTEAEWAKGWEASNRASTARATDAATCAARGRQSIADLQPSIATHPDSDTPAPKTVKSAVESEVSL
jgi:hypothetical protein